MLENFGIQFSTSLRGHEALLLDCSHSTGLVLLSVLVAVFASYTALDVGGLIPQARRANRRLWMTLFAITMGGGIWTMHYIGMLAFQAPIHIDYDPLITGFSLLVAVFGCLVAVAIFYQAQFGILRLIIAGVILGLSVVVMHYSGMAAMKTGAMVRYNPVLFSLSIMIALSAAMVALFVTWFIEEIQPRRAFLVKLVAAMMMGAAICGMHYTAMAAADFYVVGSLADMRPPRSQIVLAVLVGIMGCVIIGTALANSFFGKKLVAEERRFEQAANQFAQIFDAVPHAIVLCASDWKIVDLNRSAREMFRVPEGEGRSLGDFVKGLTVAFADSGPSTDGKFLLLKATDAEGREFPIEVSVSPSESVEARGGYLLIGRDMTEREELSQALAAHVVELRESNAAMNEFASVVNHDLRDPLRKIRLFGKKLADSLGEDLPERPAFYLDRMLVSTERLQKMLSAVIEYSKLGTGSTEREWVSLQRMVESVTADLIHSTAGVQPEFAFESLPEIYCVPDLFREVMENLLANALKFRKPEEPPRIQIQANKTVGADGAKLCIRVTDNGTGFAPAVSKKIFGLFVKGHVSGDFEGMGMGLARVEKIVRLHGGTIEALGKPGEGAVFTVEMPLPTV